MRILVLNADYPRFLDWFYARQPDLKTAPYAAQMMARNASLFGVADFYSRNFVALGHSAAEIHVNNPWLQSAWAREHNLNVAPGEPRVGSGSETAPAWLQRAAAPFKPMLRPLARKIGLSPRLNAQAQKVLLAQVEEFRPDLVLNQDVFYIDAVLARKIKQIGSPILMGQVGVEPSRGQDWSPYDLMISQLPRIVEILRKAGVRAEVSHLAFEPRVLEKLPPAPAQDVDVSFVGSISVDHRQRIAMLEAMAERFDLKLWGARPQALPSSSPLHPCFQDEVWGVDMYQVLRRSRITLNSHIDIAGKEAGNMRLFEATGVGAFLLTDFKDNLNTLFEPNREVSTWRSVTEASTRIEHFFRDGDARERIAKAGQAKTLEQHTYRRRVSEIIGFLDGLKRSP